MGDKPNNLIQSNSPDGGFLQSEYWKNFQESVGRKGYIVSATDNGGELMAYANIISHKLSVVGNYFYIPRGPAVKIFNFQFSIFKQFLNNLIDNAKKSNVGWIRIEPASDEILDLIGNSLPKDLKIKKSAVDMQPREILILDILKSEEEILAGMKQKTRYNIKLADKKGVKVHDSREEKYIEEFLRLVKVTSQRDGITSHSKEYYRKMFEIIPGDILKLYIAEYEGKIIAANLVLFFGRIATYMHGASDNKHRNLMAPYLLQWRQILDAKKADCERYDFGGVKTCDMKHATCNKNNWSGITKFKTGFAPNIYPIQFPGCYDIILNPTKYNLYRIIQKAKKIIR